MNIAIYSANQYPLIAKMPITDTGIFNQLINHGYLVMFALAVIEGPMLSIVGGFLASLGYFNLLAVYLIVASGDLAADCLYYLIGRYGGQKFVKKWGHYFFIKETRVDGLEKLFEEHPGKTLITGKIAHGLGGGVLLAAGTARMRFGPFLLYNTLATIPKSLILVLIGYYFGRAYASISKYFDYAEIGSIVIASILVIVYLYMKKRARMMEGKNQ